MDDCIADSRAELPGRDGGQRTQRFHTLRIDEKDSRREWDTKTFGCDAVTCFAGRGACYTGGGWGEGFVVEAECEKGVEELQACGSGVHSSCRVISPGPRWRATTWRAAT
eukprot:51497-Chlamydomonas_euryale.AAC.15